MQIFKSQLIFFFALLSGLIISSCNPDDDNDGNELIVPSTYEFYRDGNLSVSYSGQTQRLDMMEQITLYMKTSNTVGAAALDAAMLKDMFANENNPFSGSFTKDLESKCYPADVSVFEGFMDQLAAASTATGTASNGFAGVLVNDASETSGYRVDENGVEFTQVIEKGLMGAVFYYQAMESYLSPDRMGTTGNDNVSEGDDYTDMEHYFDEAFGYFGIPVDFPNAATLEDARFWGKYCNKRDLGDYTGINAEMSTAWRTARAAIVAKDYDSRDAAIQIIQQRWARVIAATAVGYLREGLSNSGETLKSRHHALSEAIGMMMSLKYHFSGGNSKYPPHFTYSEVELALSHVGASTNLWDLTDADINESIEHVQMAFPSGEIN